jgi:tetratricopeptide (TPR) repeat protein
VDHIETVLDPENQSNFAAIGVAHTAAVQLFDAGDVAKAAEILEQDLAAFPHDADGWTRLALCYAKLGQYDRSTSALTSAIDHEVATTNRVALRIDLAKSLTADSRFDEAINLLTSLLDAPVQDLSDSTWSRVETQRCVAWLLKDDLESHRQRCRELLKLALEQGDNKYKLSLVACCRFHPKSIDDWTAVQSIAEQLYDQEPDQWDARFNFLDILCHAGRPQEALDRFAQFRNDSHSSLAMRFASCELRLGNPEPARRALKTFDLASLHGEYYPNLKLLRQQISEQLAAFDQQQLESQTSAEVASP